VSWFLACVHVHTSGSFLARHHRRIAPQHTDTQQGHTGRMPQARRRTTSSNRTMRGACKEVSDPRHRDAAGRQAASHLADTGAMTTRGMQAIAGNQTGSQDMQALVTEASRSPPVQEALYSEYPCSISSPNVDRQGGTDKKKPLPQTRKGRQVLQDLLSVITDTRTTGWAFPARLSFGTAHRQRSASQPH
jgi:hypothetical protein